MQKVKEKPKLTIYVGRNLKKLRTQLGYSLDDIAYNTGISKAYLSQLENGQSKRPSVEVAYILANAFQVPFHLFCMNPIDKKFIDNPDRS